MNNYKLINNKYISEISSDVYYYEHNKTKAKICFIKNNDKNLVFEITFKTPPFDNSGVFHIIEHSVLSGSKKYPVKDPFIRLSQSSLANYLNAFTTKDSTSFPFATTNLIDFHNLMDVYFDAVFHPLVLEEKMIFLQEGWHYFIGDKDENLNVNGIVYNEMQGVYDNYDTNKMYNELKGLYKDNFYAKDSGGNPYNIFDLSYEKFKETYKKHYHPSNSIIMLYGDLDIEGELDKIDGYLSEFSYKEPIKFEKTDIISEDTYAVDYYQGNHNDMPIYSYNIAFEDVSFDDLKRTATNYLFRYLFNAIDSYFTTKMLEDNIDGDLDAGHDLNAMFPNLTITITNSSFKSIDDFISWIDLGLHELAFKGINKELFKSIIVPFEFRKREKYFSRNTPQGLNIARPFVRRLLYDIDPIDHFISDDYYYKIKELIDTNYFEELIKELFFNNHRRYFLSFIPKEDTKEKINLKTKEKLDSIKNNLSESEIEELIELNKKLNIYHQQDDSEEALNKLPSLDLKDINPEIMPFDLKKLHDKYDIYYSNIDVNGIIYFDLYFDLSHISYKYVKYISMLSDFLFYMPTKNKTRAEINNLERTYLGRKYFNVESIETVDGEAKLYVIVGISCLAENFEIAFNLLKEVLFETNFTNKNLKEEIQLDYSDLDSYINDGAASLAYTRCNSYLFESFKYDELLSGLEMFDYLKKVVKNPKNYYDELKTNFKYILSLLGKNNIFVDIMCKDEYFPLVKGKIDELYDILPERIKYFKSRFKPNYKNEALIVDYNVKHFFKTKIHEYDDDISYLILSKYLDTNYLWNNVRIQGGAYGVGNIYGDRRITLYSNSDPNIRRTNDVFNDLYSNASLDDLDEKTLKNLKIGVFSDERPLHPRSAFNQEVTTLLKGITRDDRRENRKRIITASLDDVKKHLIYYKDLNDSAICAICDLKTYEENKDLFKNKRKLIRR